jgi:predicted RNA-binding protein with PIN domain
MMSDFAERQASSRDKLSGMNYMIDGHNLISKIPGLSLSMPDDEEQLINRLSRSMEGKSGRIEVYFDGAPVGEARTQSYGRVRAHFVPADSTADEAIQAHLAKLGKSAHSWVVVTSDRSVQAAAHEVHASVISSEEFAQRLLDGLQDNKVDADRAPDQTLTQTELDEWMAIFKGPKKPK